MPRKSTAQLNIRSDLARQRVAELVYQTGKTATQVVEEALQAYRPPPPVERPAAPEGLEWHGKYLVFKATGGPEISTAEMLQAIDDARADRTRMTLGEGVD